MEAKEIEAAVKYCRDNNCKSYKAITDLSLQYIKDLRTINSHLAGEVLTGNEKKSQRILTVEEENSLVKYLVNRNRACQGLTDVQVEGAILNILRVRKQRNRNGGRRYEKLSANALHALQTKHVGKNFFRRFNIRYPQLKRKMQQKVSAKRGLRCTRETAIQYIDDRAAHLIQVGIVPDLVKVEPGVWKGHVDVSRIWAHDETPQFINFSSTGQSKKNIYAGSGQDCNIILKENRECVTVQPFSNFAGDMAMCQVIFSGSGMTSHMCPPAAAEKIDNLLVSVNESRCSTGETLLAAYKQLTTIIAEKNGEREESETDIVVADGHKSRFNVNIIDHCEENS